MKNISATILSLVLMMTMFSASVHAQEQNWKQYLDAGLTTLHYKELSEKLGYPKNPPKANIDSVLYSTVSRETIKKSGKYLRAVLTLFRKGETKLPSKEELDQLSGALGLVWHDEIKEAQESSQGKPREVMLASVKKQQLQMRQDNLVLLELFKKVLGEKDFGYINVKNAHDRLEQTLRKY